MTDRSLALAADDLEKVAKALFAVDGEATRPSTDEPTHELARAVAYWMVTLRRLDASGPIAWAAVDERFGGSSPKRTDSWDREQTGGSMLPGAAGARPSFVGTSER